MIRVTVNSTGVKVSKAASSKSSLASRQTGTVKPASNRDNVRASGKVAQTASRSRRIMVPVVDKTGKPLGEVPEPTDSVGHERSLTAKSFDHVASGTTPG